MNIDRFANQHKEILAGIGKLRQLTHGGIRENANSISLELKSLTRVITAHLAVEDRILYPSLRNDSNAELAAMAERYQEDMKGIANAFINFSRRWEQASELQSEPVEFRKEANVVLRSIHERIQRENTEFYPAIQNA